jgi:hypothetical protein
MCDLAPSAVPIGRIHEAKNLTALGIAAASFVLIFGGACAGAYLNGVLPKHHLSGETRDIVRIGFSLIATMVALVLGLLLASAKSSLDVKSEEIRASAARLILLDRNLRQYGPDADPIRAQLRAIAEKSLSRHWVNSSTLAVAESVAVTGTTDLEHLQRSLRELSPSTPEQRLIQVRALQVADDIAQTRWMLIEQTDGSIPWALVGLLIFWLALIFASFALFAPRNATVNATMLLCAFSVAGAIFFIIEMDRPFGGLLHVSDAPLRTAIGYLKR